MSETLKFKSVAEYFNAQQIELKKALLVLEVIL